MLTLLLQRGEPGKLSIPGELSINGVHQCYTMENLADAIPLGTYGVTVYLSPHLGTTVPLLLSVPGRSFIEIHWGNYVMNYKGCIGVGLGRDLVAEEILNTRAAFAAVFPKIQAAVRAGSCQIVLENGEGMPDDWQISSGE